MENNSQPAPVIEKDKILSALRDIDQIHLVDYYNKLPEQDKEKLLKSMSTLPFDLLKETLVGIKFSKERKDMEIEEKLKKMSPLNEDLLINTGNLPKNMSLEDMYDSGMNLIGTRKVAALIMAGGQESRFGLPVEKSKGLQEIGPISKYTFFQRLVYQLLRLQALVGSDQPTPLLILTNSLNHDNTEKYFIENNYFGLNVNIPEGWTTNVFFFKQNHMPALNPNQKILLKSRTEVNLAPDGNGSIQYSLKVSGLLDFMEKKGIKYVHIVGIDNLLTKMLDPIAFGIMEAKKAEVLNKVIRRTQWDEKVGFQVEILGKTECLEQSEIPENIAKLKVKDPNAPEEEEKEEEDEYDQFGDRRNKDKKGTFVQNVGNICNHFLSVEFIRKMNSKEISSEYNATYHISKKAIPYYDHRYARMDNSSDPNCIKLELFIFDAFKYAKNFILLEVDKKEEFAPVKNKYGKEGLVEAITTMSNYYKSWISNAVPNIEFQEDKGQFRLMLWNKSYNMQNFKSEDIKDVLEISPKFCQDKYDFVGSDCLQQIQLIDKKVRIPDFLHIDS